uniref:Reverse transcriptase domain-containing protein n=1 Tax=Tanacetum cinerariifolium TaxID=118510 RepID=A0A6L2NDZ6_TANCI|nr:reverse transcriptase domain-containing protein [Tanacetum cinerariifolium]
MHGPKPNKAIRRRNRPKLSPGQTGYSPEAARRTKGFQRTLPQDSKEKERNDKLKEVKARLNFEERFRTSQYSESRTMSTREYERRHRSRRSRSPRLSVFSRIKRDRSRSPRQNSREKEGGMFKRLGNRGKSVSASSDSHNRHSYSRIRYFDFPKIRMPSRIKTYDGSKDPDDHIKIFQAATKTKRWAMPTWCHMFNSTLTRNARRNALDPIELYNIKQRDRESTKDFMRRYKLESRDVKGAQECIRISGFVHGITNPDERGKPEAKFQERRIPEPVEAEKEARSIHGPHKTPKEIFTLEKGEFKAPPPMTTPVKKRNHTKFCEFHEEGTEGPMIIEAEIGGHCIHRMYMDGGSALEIMENITIGKDRRRRAFRFGLDEFRGGKVNISVQRNYWKSRSQKTARSSVNNSRNIETLGRRRSNYFKKKQVGPAGMCVGLRTRRDPLGTKFGRKSQGDNKPRISETSSNDWLHYHRGRPQQVVWSTPALSVKGRILADFIVEQLEEDSPYTLMEVEEELPEPWILFTNGSSYTDGSRAGLILTNPEGMEFTYALRFMFDPTNNEAEYEALIAGLRIAKQMGVKNLQANVDSRPVANQVNGTYVAKEVDMIRYLEKQVLVEELKEKSISEVEILAVVEEEENTWMTPIFEYLTEETLLADVKKQEQ